MNVTKRPTMPAARAAGAFLGLVAFEISAIALLHRLGSLEWMRVPWGSLRMWLDISPLEDVVAASLRSIATAIAYWVAISSGLYAVARMSRIPGLIRATEWATLPPVRRVIDRAIAITVTTVALAAPLAPALATEGTDTAPQTSEPIIYQISDQGVPTPVNPPLLDPTVIVPPGIADAGYTPDPAGGVVPGAATGAAIPDSVHEVVPHDNLWTISASHLRAVFPDRVVEPDVIAVYWRRVIELNRPNLRSGDPNLIYPGEQILLPELSEEGNA